MSQKQKLRPIRQGSSRSVLWFGFTISRGSAAAPLLFLGSLILIIGSLIGIIFLAINLIQILSIYSAMQQQTGEYGAQAFATAYGMTSIVILIVWMVVLMVLLGIGIYTFNKMKQIRG